jgi:hypothetical protein
MRRKRHASYVAPFPVAGMPRYGTRWMPSISTRHATESPSAKRSKL